MLANFQPGPQETAVDYHNDDRAPLLFVSGSEDHIMPPAIQQSNQKHYKSNTVTEIREYDGLCAPAARAGGLGADRRRGARLGRGARSLILTHIGGPTVLIEVDGWRLLTDPTFDPAGGHYAFGWGTSSDKVAGPALGVADLPPIDAVLLTHDHHGDNLDTAGRELLSSVATVVTTVSGARRLRAGARGLAAGHGTRLDRAGRAEPRGRRDPGAARSAAVAADRRRRRGVRVRRPGSDAGAGLGHRRHGAVRRPA